MQIDTVKHSQQAVVPADTYKPLDICERIIALTYCQSKELDKELKTMRLSNILFKIFDIDYSGDISQNLF